MSKTIKKKILEHPDFEEIVSKMCIDVPCKDINEWLKFKYTNVSESKFVISEKSLKSFKDDYLDIYKRVQQDLVLTKAGVNLVSNDDNLEGMVTYQNILQKAANEELDIRKIIKNLCLAIETRLSQVFDSIQADPENINTRIDRLLIDYTEVLGSILEKYYKFTEESTENSISHNVTLHVRCCC